MRSFDTGMELLTRLDKYTSEAIVGVLPVVSSVIVRCEKAQPKFADGTSQHTLLKNRIKALYISKALMMNENITSYTKEDLTEALRPISSIIIKCEKAQMKFAQGTTNHTRNKKLINAMVVAKKMITEEIGKRG